MAQPTGYNLRSKEKKSSQDTGIVEQKKSDDDEEVKLDLKEELLGKVEKLTPEEIPADPSGATLLNILNSQQRMINKLLELQLGVGQERIPAARMDIEKFNGRNMEPSIWITNFEVLCENNNWKSCRTRINGMRAHLEDTALAWYDSHDRSASDEDWEEWRKDFVEAFQEDPISKYDKAIKWQYRNGSYVDYFYKKLRLLQLGLPGAPEKAMRWSIESKEHLFKKLASQGWPIPLSKMALYLSVSSPDSMLLFNVNGVTIKAFLDPGSSIDLIRKSVLDKYQWKSVPSKTKLTTINQNDVFSSECVDLELEIDNHKIKVTAIVLEDMPFEILIGKPTMKKFRIKWDFGTDDIRCFSLRSREVVATVDDLRTKFPELCHTSKKKFPKSEVDFLLKPNNNIVACKPYPMSDHKRRWTAGKIEELLARGIITRSNSEYASPCILVPKKDSSYRLCIDYRRLNQETFLDPFPFPRIDTIINQFGGCQYFTKIDLKDSFWQVGLTKATRRFSAFATPDGLYEFTRLPFGWKNSPPKFQRVISEILDDLLERRVVVYLDDICCGAPTLDECASLTYDILHRLNKFNMTVNLDKCHICVAEVELLGRVINGNSKQMKEEVIEKAKLMKRPYDLKSLQCFTGFTGHFRAYIPNYSKIVRPLDNLKKKYSAFMWSTECEEAYLKLIDIITSKPILAIPDESLPYELSTDASYYGTGAVLYQRDVNKKKPHQLRVISYYSYTFSRAEQNYSITEKECLAVLKAVKHLRFYLEGKPFVVHTDHRALTQLLSCGHLRDRLARWQLFLSSFEMKVNHRSGRELSDADALSRLAIEIPNDNSQAVLFFKHQSIPLKLENYNKYFVPDEHRTSLLSLYHDDPLSGGHSGFWRTYYKMKQRFSWRGMKNDIRKYVASCPTCQNIKFKYRCRPSRMSLPSQSRVPYHTVHIDFAEAPSGVKDKKSTFLLVIDEATRLVQAKAMRQHGRALIKYFEGHDDLKAVQTIISDQGRSFVYGEFPRWAASKGIRLITSSPYHPAGNGLAERAIREIKTFLSCYPHFKGGWKNSLEAAVRYHNRSYNSYLGCSPLFKFTGTSPVLPADKELDLQCDLHETEKTPTEQNQYRQRTKLYFNRRNKTTPPELKIGDFILVRHQRVGKEWHQTGPHRVTEEIKDLESKNKAIVESKNIHRLKLFQQKVNESEISLNQVINTLLESELDDKQYDDYSKAKEDIFNMLVSIEEALSLIETKENTHSDKQLPESNVNLPKINLPIFNGDSANWLSFREIFNSTINSNQTLTEIQKFQYLNASVKGPAEKLIRGFPISDKNYQQAWDTLCNRFNNRRELAFSQINKIFSIRPLKSISAGSLYEILDVCNEGIRNLSVLGLEKNTLTDLILINFFEKRIGEALRKEWELTLQNEEYPTFENFVNFLEKHARSLQGMRIPLFQEQKTSSKNMMAHGLYVNKGQNCILCHQIHKLNDCQRFINLPLPKKWELVKKHKLCQNCLRANHEISKCLITSRCKNCKQNHHTLLHEYNSEPSIPQPTTSQEMLISTNTICNAMPLETETNILLSTALIKVKAKDGSFVLCRALVDNGSQISLISEQCCHKLGLEKRKNSYTLKGVGDIVVNRTTSQVEIEFTPHHNDQLFSARAFVVGRVTADLPNFQIQSADFPHLENLLLADPEFYVTKPIDLILGADTFVEFIIGHKTDLKHHPIALNTKLGWLVSGRIHSTIKSNTSVINHCTTELDSSIRKFWELEDVPISKAQLGIKNAPSPSLQESIQNSPSLKEFTQNSPSLQESIQNSPSLQEFTQNFPSLPGSIQTSPSLPDSVQGSPSLTLSLQSSKHNSPTPLQVSVHSLKEAMSPLVEMPSSPGCSKQIPIPIEEDSIESQNRVDNLPSYPMSPEQSYTLSSASVEDFKAQSGPKSPTSPTRGSESCRCSGDYTEPQMSQNSNFSCSSIEGSEDNSSKSEENLSRSEDNPSKSEEIPSKSKKSRISKLTPQITTKQNQLLPSESSQPSTPEQPLASQSSEPLSSKKETSIIPKIKPPPYYRLKRQLPAEKTLWDEPIESDIKSNWNKFQTQLSCLKEIKIPRYLNSSSSEIEELQLHGFCDASLNAYSAVFYLKTRFKIQKIKINLITSKTKVAPLKTITIPRLELSAALLLAQLNQVILESFPFQPDKTFLWTDSQICIDWIRSDASRWKAFVSNRVSSIQNLTQITDWFHVSSQDNPADCASRGIMPQDLVNHRIWWRGPIWLQENNARYIPSSPTQVNLNIIQEEVSEGQVLDQTTLIQNSETMLNLEFIVRYSTMTKLIRITAWCWRFYYNCLLFDPIRQKGPLTTRELTKAIQVLVKSIQQVEFCTEIKLLKSNKQLPLSNKLTFLNTFLDTQGLQRVGGRLKYSYLNENQKFPLLQPKSPRQESLIKNLLTENADIPEAIDENQEDSSILETTFVIEDEESNKDIGTPKIEISEVSVIDKSEGKYSKEPVVSVEALDKKELCHDDSAHLNVVEADLNRPKEATSGIINVYTEANESSSKEKVVPVEIVDTSTKDYLQSGEKAKLSRWKPIDSLCLEDVKESEDDDENYSSSAYIEWPEILKKEVLRPEALEKAVNLEDFEKAAESRQLSKEHLEESTEQGSCIKAESKSWEDPIESDLAAAESDNPAQRIWRTVEFPCLGADAPKKYPTSSVLWTERSLRRDIPQAESRGRKDILEDPSSSNLRTEKDVLDNQRVATIGHRTRQAKPATVLPRGRDRFKGDMEEMDALKKRRKAIRGTFTRIINEINGEFEKSQIDRNDIYSKFNRLESYYTKLVDLNEKYQALLVVKEGITEESIDKEWQECDKYEEEKFDIQQKVSVLRNPDKEETIPIASEDTVINVKLPELALKSYDGSLEGWLPWWAQFSKIHENKNLSDSDRFLYLRQAIVPNSEAYRVVASYPVTGANYALAVQALQERFGDPNILTELYVRRLLNSVISNVKKENRNLSSLYDELSSHLRSLETLGIDPQLSGIFLYPLVESSLPSDILKIWHRHPSSGYGMELAKREESDKGVGGAQERLRLLLDFLKAESQCREQLECKNCGRNHLEVLCEGNSSNRLTKPGRENLKENATEPIASLSSQACTGQVLLMTTVALLRGPNASRRVRILLDSGSQFSYIKQSLVWSIGIERKGEITIAKSLFGGNKIGEEKHGKFMLELENLGNKRDVIHIEALDQRKICDAIPPLPKGDWLEKLKIKGIILSQDNFKGQEIDILIGANYLGMILTGKIVQVEADLTAVETKLGWTLMGNSPIIDSNDNVQQTLNLLTTRCDLKDLWDLEVLGIRDPVETCSKETRYQEIKEKFITKIQRQSDQRYSVGLPWKVEKESIPSNLDIAIKRLDISTKKMTSQNKLTEYSQIFSDWLTEGLIERVEENPLERRGYYLPHRPVYKMESKTTPIRPVFDASCLGHNGLSLNQCLEKGPNLLERIPEIMIRFRENKFGVTADIRKAFQMVAIEESERNYLRFLWWEKESDRELIPYRHKRLVFGLNCSPFVLNAVIEYHLQSIRGPLVQWAKILAQSFYMDNCITSLETKQEVQEFQKAAIEIMDRAKMDLREWEYSLEENPGKGTCTKILGVVWNKMEDSLKCELPDNLSIQPKLTKRLVLSMVQRIFDPLGFCAPVFLPPKLLLQRSWGLKLGWDTPLPESMAQEFRTWLDQIKFIELIKIPRYMWNDLIFPTEVHIFCDASQTGYGAVAYLRSETGRENTLTLIWSKVRLAPMKSITIPRLELMAMVLGARLANAIQAALKRKCETTLWSDSTTALSWIKREIEWRVFVRNRVREIQATTNLNDWRFVPSQLNPADLLSRGCPPSQFVQSRWWEGPEWLKKPKEFWPNSEFSINPKEIKVEENIMKTNINLNIDYKDWLLTRRSNYSLNIRVMSYVLRFLGKLKKQSTETGPLKVSELDLAEKKLIRMIQEKVSIKKSNATKSFKILKNTDGLWCVESKLLHGQVPEEFKTPIILPGDHPFVEQLIWEVHLKNGHVGVQFILSKLREKFWIIRGRKTIKKIISKCIACKRLKEKSLQRPMAALPENRIGLGKPFQITGVDLLGPLHLKEGGKVWVAAFTCAVYRAIHLELVKSLETGVFMMALHRFICRRGRPEKIYSDNGTNFAKLNRIFKRLDWTRIERETSIKRIQWIFIPPSAPWWGGFWERMVRTIKEMLIKMLGHRKLKYVQLQTALCEIESIINNRPLTYVSEDDNDLKPLTPNEFLQNGPESSFPEFENLKPEMLHTRYRELGQLKRELKQRFLKEYLGALIQKSENIDRRQLKVGDVVLIRQENLKRMFWPKGRIVNLIPGKDGIVRVAHVKTSTGTLIRALQRLHSLEISSNVKTIQKDNSNTEPQSDAFLGNRPNIESRDSRNRYGRVIRKPARYDLKD
ncbi:hypothetical protein LAZ67_8002739 [Cordylochernes scorpioides]|uniref:RNA-directed DNA polymerase n=1 Tax=Cordylochernes scorpioides TaxID=51811 RepID=A0ABY6KW82_9ARAC|nr:hypothetical protein LAZ67_8002739 [Cordylochernes scorpioides]